MSRNHLIAASTLMVSMLAADHAFAVFVKLDPKATYLLTNSDPGSLDAVPVALASIPVQVTPGTFLSITQLGDFTPSEGFNPDNRRGLGAVFSSTNVLLGASTQNRVPGAIDAGTDIVTPVTAAGGLATEISEDFIVSNGSTAFSTVIQVPAGANFIFFSVPDSRFFDNGDPDNDFGVELVLVPEPGTFALVVATSMLPLSRRRR